MKNVSARKVWCTTRWKRRPDSVELRFHRYMYQGVRIDPDSKEEKPCGDGACFHTKRSAAVRCAVHTAQRAER